MKIVFILLTFSLSLLHAKGFAHNTCALDSSGEMTVFYCADASTGRVFNQAVDPIKVEELLRALNERETNIISLSEFAALLTAEQSSLLGLSLNWQHSKACIEKVYYKVDEFNRLPDTDPTIGRLKELARALQEAGVCELPVVGQTFNGINIQTIDDVLHQFLCISNSESVFGRDNLGLGGRGPWGVHPMHNQKAGTTAFSDGKTVRLERDGLCYPGNAVVRDAMGEEIKDNSLYQNYDVRLANARCALKLYQRTNNSGQMRGFRPWGTTEAWGSNRHCSKTSRDRLQFLKHIGVTGCCSEACKERVQETI